MNKPPTTSDTSSGNGEAQTYPTATIYSSYSPTTKPQLEQPKAQPIPHRLWELVGDLREAMGMEVWLLIQIPPSREWVKDHQDKVLYDLNNPENKQGDDKKKKNLENTQGHNKEKKTYEQVKLSEKRRQEYSELTEGLRTALFRERKNLKDKIALVIDSPGGSPKAAYQLAKFFRDYGNGFEAVIPRSAKSAATLLTLGADKIHFGTGAELGPLDARYTATDPKTSKRKKTVAVLDRVQMMQRMHASALDALELAMALLLIRTDESVTDLLPIAKDFAVGLTLPLMEKMDINEHTQMARVLKIAEDYAARLLEHHFSKLYYEGELNGEVEAGAEGLEIQAAIAGSTSRLDPQASRKKLGNQYAQMLAKHLVGAYADHGFAIDEEEARSLGGIGLPTVPRIASNHEDKIRLIVDELQEFLATYRNEPAGLTVIGTVQGPTHPAQGTERNKNVSTNTQA